MTSTTIMAGACQRRGREIRGEKNFGAAVPNKHMRRHALFLFFALSTACAGATGPGRCSSSNCAGCCDERGTCQVGTTASACGAHGSQCGRCGLGLICTQAQCAPPSASVNTGGGPTGPGPHGGGTTSSRVLQELTSGSRLRAIHLAGTDGSRAPLAWGLNVSAIFWDSQLSLYCTPVAQGVSAPLCEPLGLGYTEESDAYADSRCTIHTATANDPADLNASLRAAGLPTSTVTHLRRYDPSGRHSWYVAMRVPMGAPQYVLIGTACQASGTFSEAVWAEGAPVPESTFAAMAIVRD
jgi:hypothetical protein